MALHVFIGYTYSILSSSTWLLLPQFYFCSRSLPAGDTLLPLVGRHSWPLTPLSQEPKPPVILKTQLNLWLLSSMIALGALVSLYHTDHPALYSQIKDTFTEHHTINLREARPGWRRSPQSFGTWIPRDSLTSSWDTKFHRHFMIRNVWWKKLLPPAWVSRRLHRSFPSARKHRRSQAEGWSRHNTSAPTIWTGQYRLHQHWSLRWCQPAWSPPQLWVEEFLLKLCGHDGRHMLR